MTRRIEQAIVEYDECDGCGDQVRTEALVGADAEKFDPRSRSAGFHPLYLWPRHPWDGAKLCSACSKWSDDGGRRGYASLPPQGRDIAYDVPGMVRIAVFDVEPCDVCGAQRDGSAGSCTNRYCQQGWVYNERGLRLPSAPPGHEQVSKYASAIVRRGDKAVVLHERDGYWVPTSTNVGRLSDEWMRDLAFGDRKIIVCEQTAETPWPTVFEPTLPGGSWEAQKADPELWGHALCERAEDGDGVPMIHPCSLRVPREILQ